MTRPWQPPGTLHQVPIYKERTTCAALIGELVIQWSHAEGMLARIFSDIAIGTNLPGVPHHPGAWVAMETFDMVTNYEQKRKMILLAAKRRGLPTEKIEKLDSLLADLRRTDKGRMHAAHGRWMIDKRYPDSVVWQQNIGNAYDAQIYDVSDFEIHLSKVNATMDKLQGFWISEIHPIVERLTQAYIDNVRSAKDLDNPV